MDIQDNFRQWFEAYRDSATLSSFRALAADLTLLINEHRVRYWNAEQSIVSDLASGEPRPDGKPRLRLALTELAQHMQARQDRAAAQQQLSVLVPLAHRVTIAVQQWREGDRAPDAALAAAIWLVPLTLHLMAGRSAMRIVPKHMTPFGYGGKVERALAVRLMQAHPAVFYKPAPAVPPLEAKQSAGHGCIESDVRTQLHRKILGAVALSDEEKRVLAFALRPVAA